MRLLKNALLMSSLLLSAFALLGLFSLRSLPAQPGRGGVAGTTINGDADCDGQLTINDPVKLLNHLFLGGSAPCALAQEQSPCCPEVVAKLDAILQAVRSLKDSCATPENRFLDNRDGTVADSCTGLMWQQAPAEFDVDLDGSKEHLFNYNQALLVISRSSVGGYTDWRLPTINELETIMDFIAKRSFSLIRLPPFGFNLNEPGFWFWSSTEEGIGNLYIANISPNTLGLDSANKDAKERLWLVRTAR